jgi:hypothetical protein
LYRQIRRLRPARIVELGIGDGRRTTRMLEVAARYAPTPLEYTGVDLFETRGNLAEGMLTLKEAHRLLKPLAARVRLLPGDAHTALAQAANMLTNTDLFIISADQDAEAVRRAWFYVPRMLHAETLVLQEHPAEEGETRLASIARLEIEQWAAEQAKVRRRAA